MKKDKLERKVRIGSIDNKSVYVKIKYTIGKLSITGVVNPRQNGDADSYGQIFDDLLDVNDFEKDWDYSKISNLHDLWKKYHLNDMNAGTVEQDKAIERGLSKNNLAYEYDLARKILVKANLLIDNGYEYGTKWLKRPVPLSVLKWLFSIKNTERQPCWI